MKVSFYNISQLSTIQDVVKYGSQIFTQIQNIFTNGVSFGDNIDCKIVSVIFSGTSVSNVTHGLGRTPVGYFPVGLSVPMTISSNGMGNSTSIPLQSTVSGTAQMCIF